MRISHIIKRLKKRNREPTTSHDGDEEQQEGEEEQRQHHDGKRHLHDEIDDMVQTPFPDLTETGAAEYVGSDEGMISDVDSDDEEAIQQRQAKYQTKVDQDVAVFLKLTEQMSLESLLFVMEGQARTQNLNYMEKYKHTEGDDSSDDSDSDSDSDSEDDEDESYVEGEEGKEKEEEKEEKEEGEDKKETLKPAVKKRASAVSKSKQFRFAEITGNKVREVIYEIDPLKDFGGDLWWQDGEIREIRKAAIETVRFYVRHRKDFKASVEQVYCAETQQEENPKDVKKLADESFVRGLEGHIVPVFANRRSDFRKAIVELQNDFSDKNDYDRISSSLSECSSTYSQQTTKFALRMAQIDYLEALKSNMSRWRPENEQTSSSGVAGFFDC